MASTDEVLDTYLQTRSYKDTATIHGMSYDAVRKRIRRNIPPGSTTHVKGGSVVQQWLREPKTGCTAEEVRDAVLEGLKNYRPPAPLKTALKGDSDLLAFYPLADLHIGMRSWKPETGIDWDLDIAKKVYREGISDIVARSPKVKQAVVLIAGDLLHADSFHYQTSNPSTSHVVDCDGRYPKILEEALDIVLFAVDTARQRAEKVHLGIIPGNHDEAASVAIRLAAARHYRGDKAVEVCKAGSPHWWYEWGKTMLAATHGDKLRMRRLGQYMASDQCEIWGRTSFRFGFTGHLHNKEVQSQPGCQIEILPTPVGADSYASSHGYDSLRMFEAKIFSKKAGLWQTITRMIT